MSTMFIKYCVLFYILTYTGTVLSYETSELKCLICKVVVGEIEKVTKNISKTRTVQVAGYSLDEKGNKKQKTIPMVHSEQYLSEVLDDICEKTMANYVRVTDKITGELQLMDLMAPGASGKFADVDFIQDSDLNKSVEYLCKGIVEEYEDAVFKVFGRESDARVEELCVRGTDLCSVRKEEL